MPACQTLLNFTTKYARESPLYLALSSVLELLLHETYLVLNTLKRGENERDRFQDEWKSDHTRFLQPVKSTRAQNFAAQNAKTKSRLPAIGKTKANAESLRDMFVRMIVVVSEKTSLGLRKIISYPITTYPLSLASCDWTHMKTEKSVLLRKFECFQTETDRWSTVTYRSMTEDFFYILSCRSQPR